MRWKSRCLLDIMLVYCLDRLKRSELPTHGSGSLAPQGAPPGLMPLRTLGQRPSRTRNASLEGQVVKQKGQTRLWSSLCRVVLRVHCWRSDSAALRGVLPTQSSKLCSERSGATFPTPFLACILTMPLSETTMERSEVSPLHVPETLDPVQGQFPSVYAPR